MFDYFRKVLLPTPPKMSKQARRQMFEAKVRAEEAEAELQRLRYMQHQQQQQQQQQQSMENNFSFFQEPLFEPPTGGPGTFQDPNIMQQVGKYRHLVTVKLTSLTFDLPGFKLATSR